MDAFDVDAGIGSAEFTARLCRTDVWSTQTMRKLESLAAEAADELQLDQGGVRGGHAAAAAASMAASNDLQAILDQLTASKSEHAGQLERQANRHAEEINELRRALTERAAAAGGAGRLSPRAASPVRRTSGGAGPPSGSAPPPRFSETDQTVESSSGGGEC
jgi:hypothetical protein